MKRSKILTLLIVGVSIPTLLFTSCKPRTPEEKADRIVRYIDRKLDLTDEQRKVLDKIKIDILARKGEVKTIHDEIHADLKKQILSDKVDTANVKKRMKARSAKIEELKFFMVDKLAEFHKVLTPEQKKELIEKIEKHERRHRW